MRAQKLATPRAEFLMTVGKNSAEYRKIVANAAEEPTLPTRDKSTVTHPRSVDKETVTVQQVIALALKKKLAWINKIIQRKHAYQFGYLIINEF